MQHEAGKDLAVLEREVRSLIVAPACQTYLPIDEHTEILVNPSGQFVEGGPRADTGLTGRKLMVDTYGGLGSHGGARSPARTIQGRPVSGLHGSPDRSYDH